MDFLEITEAETKKGTEIYPSFIVDNKTKDLMIRGTRPSDFRAVWVEEKGLWSTDEQDLINLVDHELDKYYEEHRGKWEKRPRILYMRRGNNKMIDAFHHYCREQMRDNSHPLDEKLIFSDQKTTRRDYASKKLSYPLAEGSIDAYEKIISTLYSEEERHKIEWAVRSCMETPSASRNLWSFTDLRNQGSRLLSISLKNSLTDIGVCSMQNP